MKKNKLLKSLTNHNLNKKGNIPLEEVIFVLLNIMFFSMLFVFVYNTSHGVFLSEKLYAKKIALAIDSAKPGTQISVDISELYGIAQENEFDISDSFYFKDNQVNVKLSKEDGYSYNYFTNYQVESVISFPEEDQAILNIKVRPND
ncbi:hypothetical protein AUJ62_03545 [Candidatus Pacearchaeota archaeon CG1_02_32_21]|nr:MAG: hypothetical protein AUJ62_03545 [Candidatus Pacearchaeota archaeon CG1_02_32_21]